MKLIKAVRNLYILVITLSWFASAIAQDYNLTNTFTTKDGLPSNLVYESILDNDGFLWVATDNGISRFDGTRFINYSTKNGLPSNDVIQVIRQDDGTIWANCYKQPPSYFDVRRNRFVCLDSNPDVVELSKNLIINHDNINSKGLLFQNNLGYFIIKDRRVTTVEKKDISERKRSKYTLHIENKFHTVETYTINKDNSCRVQFTFYNDERNLGTIELFEQESHVSTNFQNDEIYQFTSNTVSKLSAFKTKPLTYKIAKIKIPDTIKWYRFSNGKLNISCMNGTVYIYNQSTLLLERILITGAILNTAFVDLNNQIWVSTQGDGLHYYSKSAIKQEQFPSLTNLNMLSVKKVSDEVLFAGNFQGEIFKKARGKVTKYYYNNVSLSDNRIKDIHVFKDKTIVFTDAGLNIDFKKNIRIYKATNRLIHLKSSLKLNDNTLIIGSLSGLFLFNSTTESYKPLNFPEERILSLKKKNDHSFYFVANKGLFEYDIHTDNYKTVLSNNYFKNDDIQLFEVIDDNKLWVGTYKGNLFQIHNGKIIKNLSANEQVPINIVKLLDSNNMLWIASKEGIYVLDHTSDRFNNIYSIKKADGLISDYINDLENYKDTLFVATDKGVSKVPIRNFITAFKISPKVISVKINGKIIPLSKKFNLNSYQTNAVIELAGVDVTGHFKKLEYKLKDTDFSVIDGNFLNIQLKNGLNKITVRSRDVNNMVHVETIELAFYVATPFYKTIWFWVLISFLVTSGILLSLNRRRLSTQNLKFQQQLALEKQRNQITADLHDDIGATLSSLQLNSAVANYLIKKDTVKTQLILEKIENQSKNLADKIGDIVWSMKPGKNEFMTFSSRIKNFAADILGAINCEYTISIDDEIDTILTDITARKNVVLIAKEAVNNCAKYSKASNVVITMRLIDNYLELKIIDNGIGFNLHIQQGNGLQNMQQRALEIRGNLQIDSVKNMGTKITLQFPYP